MLRSDLRDFSDAGCSDALLLKEKLLLVLMKEIEMK